MTYQPIYGPFISRDQAKERGMRHYFDGLPCKNGHISVRKVFPHGCLECQRLVTKNYRKKLRENSKQNTQEKPREFSKTNWPNGFYTYSYIREDGRPYYIGKGKEGRAWAPHGSKKKRWHPPNNNQIEIIKFGLTEKEAHEQEMDLIKYYKDLGWLTLNFTDGGEGAAGYEYTDELRKQRAEQLKGNNYGANVNWTPELRAKLSASKRGKKMPVTEALLKARDRLHIRVKWQHPVHGTHFGSASEIGRKFKLDVSNLNRVRLGEQRQYKSWICLDPVKKWIPKTFDVNAKNLRSAATRNAKNAQKLNMTTEEYNQLSYNQRSRLRKMDNPRQTAIQKGWLKDSNSC